MESPSRSRSSEVTRPGSGGERLVVAHVQGPHGIRGAVRIEVLTDDPARFDVGEQVFREGDDRPLTVAEARTTGRGTVVRFEEVGDRTAAEALRGRYLEAPARERHRRGEYFWHEVVGTRVRDRSGKDLGTVRQILRAGGGDVAVVEGADGELLVPLVREFVPRFAPRRGVMVVDAERLGIAGSRRGDR